MSRGWRRGGRRSEHDAFPCPRRASPRSPAGRFPHRAGRHDSQRQASLSDLWRSRSWVPSEAGHWCFMRSPGATRCTSGGRRSSNRANRSILLAGPILAANLLGGCYGSSGPSRESERGSFPRPHQRRPGPGPRPAARRTGHHPAGTSHRWFARRDGRAPVGEAGNGSHRVCGGLRRTREDFGPGHRLECRTATGHRGRSPLAGRPLRARAKAQRPDSPRPGRSR